MLLLAVAMAMGGCILIGVVPLSGAQAQIAEPPTPGVLLEQQRKAEEERKKQERIIQPRAPAQITKPAQPRPPKGGGKTVTVARFTFSGNTVVTTTELEEAVADAVGKALTVAQLHEVAAKVSELYVRKGYILSRAYLPPQEIREGVVAIAVLEAKVGDIFVTGNRRYASSTIVRRLEPVKREAVIRERTLETALNDLNEYPGLKVRADFKPGASLGVTDLALTATERPPYTVGADINNYGSRLTGPWVYGGDVGLGNLLGMGDNLTVRGSKSDDNLFFTTVGYLVPLTSFGTMLQLTWTHSESVIGEEFAVTRPEGRADIASADILQTLTRTSAFSLTAVAGFDFKTIRNISAIPGPSGSLQSKDEIRIVRLGLRGEYRDAFWGRTYYGLTWHYGGDFLGGSDQNAPQTSFAGAGPGRWSKATADLSRFQSLGLPFLQGVPVLPTVLNDSYLMVRATGQIASDRLLSPEQFSIGGYYSVRGYPVSERIGDNGYTVTAELVTPIPSSEKAPFSSRSWKEMVQVAVFIDHGGTFAAPISAGQGGFGYLTGAGAGLRIMLPFGLSEPADRGALSLKIDWATAIGRPRPSSRNQGLSLNHVYGDGAAGVLYVSASMRF